MRLNRASMRAATLMLAATVATGAVACRDSTGPDDHADEVHAVRLTITAAGITPRVVTFTEGVAAPQLQVPTGTSTVTAVWLAEDGDVLSLDSDFVLQIDQISPAAAFTFQRTSAQTGTLTASSAGTATARVCVMHGSHCDISWTATVVIGG